MSLADRDQVVRGELLPKLLIQFFSFGDSTDGKTGGGVGFFYLILVVRVSRPQLLRNLEGRVKPLSAHNNMK